MPWTSGRPSRPFGALPDTGSPAAVEARIDDTGSLMDIGPRAGWWIDQRNADGADLSERLRRDG